MSSLIFTCPVTGRDIVSGVNTDPRSLSQVRHLSVSLFCPHCGKVHHSSAKNGRLSDKPTTASEPPSEKPAMSR